MLVEVRRKDTVDDDRLYIKSSKRFPVFHIIDAPQVCLAAPNETISCLLARRRRRIHGLSAEAEETRRARVRICIQRWQVVVDVRLERKLERRKLVGGL